jgi:TonB family protein
VVVIEAVIARDGNVEADGLHVVQSDDPLDEPARDAFQRWRFAPAHDAEGRTVRVLVRQAIRFQLR